MRHRNRRARSARFLTSPESRSPAITTPPGAAPAAPADDFNLMRIVNKGFKIGDRVSLFIEADFPSFSRGGTSCSPRAHAGLGF